MAENKDLWASAMAEVENLQSRDAGLWAKCYAEADGDESKAKASYIKARVEQLKPAPTTGYCPSCNNELALNAENCPKCKAIFAQGSDWAPTLTPQGTTPRTKEAEKPAPSSFKWWKWALGLPIGGFLLLMLIGSLNSNPEKTQARRVYELCLSDLASADRARSSTRNFIASTCEKLRSDFMSKYGVAP